ncbi:MAG: hypothetical protein AABY18_02275 [Candidatus Thermoplasmatota archaeon]
MKRIALPLLALFLLAATPVQGQLSNPDEATPTTLYFHIFDTFNPFPINTQPMDVAFFDVGGTSFPTVSNTIVSQQVGDYDFNTMYGFLTSGPVEYDFIENGRPRFHPERGIASDVILDDSTAPTVYLYMDVRDLFSTDASDDLQDLGWSGLPSALPSFTFRFEMRAGNSLGADDLQSGTLLMSGAKTAHVIDGHLVPNDAFVGQSVGDTPILTPDEFGIVEWAIPLDVKETVIPKADAFHVRLDWYQNPSGDPANDDAFAQGQMRLVSGAGHLPRLDLAIRNPVYIEYIHPEVAAGILLIHSCVNSPWGTYDVDVANITLAVTGPTAPEQLTKITTQNAHVHGLHDKCAEITYLWRFRAEDAANGDYAIKLAVPNLDASAVATGQAGFTVEGKKAFGVDEQGNEVPTADSGGGKKSPLPAGALLAVGLVALAALRRRSA